METYLEMTPLIRAREGGFFPEELAVEVGEPGDQGEEGLRLLVLVVNLVFI